MSQSLTAVSSFFHGAHDFTITGGNFLEVYGDYNVHNYIASASATDNLLPLPPLKHSSTLFTGRNEYLQRLKEYFSPLPNSERKSFLLHGMGGIGKTQICLKFIEETTNWFSDVFWIDASSKDAIELRLKQIGKVNALTSDPTASAALQWISSRDNWLIVYDNADGGYEVIEKFLPPGNKGNILITSRNRAMGRITSHKNSFEVGQMGEVEAILELSTCTGGSGF